MKVDRYLTTGTTYYTNGATTIILGRFDALEEAKSRGERALASKEVQSYSVIDFVKEETITKGNNEVR